MVNLALHFQSSSLNMLSRLCLPSQALPVYPQPVPLIYTNSGQMQADMVLQILGIRWPYNLLSKPKNSKQVKRGVLLLLPAPRSIFLDHYPS